MAAKANLHIHTTASDGKTKPRELVSRAAHLNLSIISITDHDTTAGVSAAQEEAKQHDIGILNGVEVTGLFKNRECHFLAYHFDLNNQQLNKLLKQHQKVRRERAGFIIRQLRKKGLQIDLAETLAEASGNAVGRPHIAAMLMKKGYVRSAKEAFIRYLSDGKLKNTDTGFQECEKIIKIVHRAGGAVILAHPGRMYSIDEMKQLIRKGIDGIEAVHPSHHTEMKTKLRRLAERHQLLITGGSDFHGTSDDIARQLENHTVDITRVTKIEDYCLKLREPFAKV
jgi:predicted metal-dependent phosphoesterase TrpH